MSYKKDTLLIWVNRTFCKQTVMILIRHRIMRCLIWISTVCLCAIKKDARFIQVNSVYFMKEGVFTGINAVLIYPYSAEARTIFLNVDPDQLVSDKAI